MKDKSQRNLKSGPTSSKGDKAVQVILAGAISAVVVGIGWLATNMPGPRKHPASKSPKKAQVQSIGATGVATATRTPLPDPQNRLLDGFQELAREIGTLRIAGKTGTPEMNDRLRAAQVTSHLILEGGFGKYKQFSPEQASEALASFVDTTGWFPAGSMRNIHRLDALATVWKTVNETAHSTSLLALADALAGRANARNFAEVVDFASRRAAKGDDVAVLFERLIASQGDSVVKNHVIIATVSCAIAEQDRSDLQSSLFAAFDKGIEAGLPDARKLKQVGVSYVKDYLSLHLHPGRFERLQSFQNYLEVNHVTLQNDISKCTPGIGIEGMSLP